MHIHACTRSHHPLPSPSCLPVCQGVNKDSYLILDRLPPEYDSRVKAMEVDERPTESYTDIGGLDKQIREVRLQPNDCV